MDLPFQATICRSSTEISRNPYHYVSIACAIAINLDADICSSHSHLSLYNLLFVSASGLTKLLVTHRIAGEPPTKCVRKRTPAYIVRSAHITHARTRARIHTGVGPLARIGIGYPPLRVPLGIPQWQRSHAPGVLVSLFPGWSPTRRSVRACWWLAFRVGFYFRNGFFWRARLALPHSGVERRAEWLAALEGRGPVLAHVRVAERRVVHGSATGVWAERSCASCSPDDVREGLI